MLGKWFLSVSLISVEVWHVFIQLDCLARDYQCSSRPKFLVIAQFLLALVDIETKGKSFPGEHKLIADGG